MFFKPKSKKEEKKELLYRENVIVGCEPDTKENIIRKVGQMLVDSGYVNQPYVDGMVEREKHFPHLWEMVWLSLMVWRL